MNQTTIAGKASFASLLHGKRRGKAKIDPRVDVTHQLKKSNTSRKALRIMYPACLLQLGWQPHLQAYLAWVLVMRPGENLLLVYFKEIVGLYGKMISARKEQAKGPMPYS